MLGNNKSAQTCHVREFGVMDLIFQFFFSRRLQFLFHGTTGIFFFFAMYISNAKFEEHRSNIARYIRDSVFYCFSRHLKKRKQYFAGTT